MLKRNMLYKLQHTMYIICLWFFFSVVVTTNMSRNVTFGPKVIVVQDIKMSPGDVNVSMCYL